MTKDGRHIPVDLTLALVEDDDGRYLGVASIVRNITARKVAERSLRESGARFRSAFEQGGSGMAILDLEGRFLQVNSTLGEMLGYPDEELRGMTSLEVTHSDDLPKSSDALRKIRRDRGAVVIRKRYVRKDGGIVHALVAGSSFRDEPAGQDLYVTQFVDVTDRERLKTELRQAQKMEAVGTLAGGIAHDMNNVLAVVLGFSSVLDGEMDADDPKRRDVREIVAAARRGRSLVEKLLGFARTKA